jgi:glycosyltransferase involved in cell wall biosynthesis
MKTISGFTFIHNAIDSGYPIVEAIQAVRPYVNEIVVVDMESTDNTREILEQLPDTFVSPYDNNIPDIPIRIIDGFWGNEAGKTLRQAHSKYVECSGDIIIHFEADEVYDDSLIQGIIANIHSGLEDMAVYRLQLEQNFQRCRWYPEPVHRVFSRLSHTHKDGHTTDRYDLAFTMEPKNGYLWDITNCFRDNWINRIKKQAELRNEEPKYLMETIHTLLPAITTEREAMHWLYSGKHWRWTNTPFNIPEILKPLVGMTKYEPRL